ncbi:VirK/YbjX family protein [Aeromonas sp. 601115]|uniref:VirK/YbjX family protein n=1 Tax=Aeromonas sp. 601115 TaxID=2712038 RepID=UPI003B9DD14B
MSSHLSHLRTLARRLHPVEESGHLIRRAKYVGRLWLNPGARALYRQQQEQPLLAQAISRFPDILEKPIHPYRHKGLSKRLRAGLISDHYRQLARQLPKAQQLAIYSGRGLLLARWQSDKLTAPLTLQLDYQTHMAKEGEMSLTLKLGDAALYHMALNLRPAPSPTLEICSLQGGKGLSEEIKQVTKACGGLRPMSLLVYMAAELAQGLACNTLLGIRTQSHVYQSSKRTADRVKFDLDGLWQEHQGSVQDELWMSLPLEVPRKTLEEIPSRKRVSYKARYQLLDQLGSELQANLLRS